MLDRAIVSGGYVATYMDVWLGHSRGSGDDRTASSSVLAAQSETCSRTQFSHGSTYPYELLAVRPKESAFESTGKAEGRQERSAQTSRSCARALFLAGLLVAMRRRPGERSSTGDCVVCASVRLGERHLPRGW